MVVRMTSMDCIATILAVLTAAILILTQQVELAMKYMDAAHIIA